MLNTNTQIMSTQEQEQNVKPGDSVYSLLSQHKQLACWRVLEVTTGLTGRKRYFCEAQHDTKSNFGFDKMKFEFSRIEFETK